MDRFRIASNTGANAQMAPSGTSTWLAFDTCGPYLAVILVRGRENRFIVQPGQSRSSIDLVPAIQTLLDEMKVVRPERILVTVGPGSFTGVRIGVTTARNLGMLWDVPIVPLYSLQLYALSLQEERDSAVPSLICLDGKQNKFYSLFFRNKADILEAGLPDIQDWTPQSIRNNTNRNNYIYCDEPDLLLEKLQSASAEPAGNTGSKDYQGPTVKPLPRPDPSAFYLFQDRGALAYPEILPVYVRADPATARYPDGFQHKPDQIKNRKS